MSSQKYRKRNSRVTQTKKANLLAKKNHSSETSQLRLSKKMKTYELRQGNHIIYNLCIWKIDMGANLPYRIDRKQ